MNPTLLKFQEGPDEAHFNEWDNEELPVPSMEDFKRVLHIGHGGYGDVYKVKYNNKLYALKIVKSNFKSNEKKALSLLKDCSNIVHMFWGLSNAIILEFTSMGSIYDLIQVRGRLSNLEAANITRQTLQGLKVVHDRGIIHCDIKCSNILIFPNGEIKICDFGLCQFINGEDSKRSNEGHEGSIYWLAPELVKDHTRNYDFKSDIWSLGCSVIEMINGSPPFSGYGYAKVLHLLSELKSPQEVMNGLDNFKCCVFLSECLIINPIKRPNVDLLLENTWVKVKRNVLKYVEFAQNEDDEDEKNQLLSKYKEDEEECDDFDINGGVDVWPIVQNLETANDSQIIQLTSMEIHGQNWILLKRKIVPMLISHLNNSCDIALQLANVVFNEDREQLEKFIFSGYLPQLLSKHHGESLHVFIEILLNHPKGLEWFKIAGGEIKKN